MDEARSALTPGLRKVLGSVVDALGRRVYELFVSERMAREFYDSWKSSNKKVCKRQLFAFQLSITHVRGTYRQYQDPPVTAEELSVHRT